MGYPQAYAAYKETGVKTASQGKLIVMLYSEAVKQLGFALTKFDSQERVAVNNIEDLHKNISKTQDILTELMVSLDMDKGGEIAKNLMALYMFFNQELMEASLKHDKKKIEDVRSFMNDLRSAWITASEQAVAPAPNMRPSVDING